MKIQKHPEYVSMQVAWQKCRDLEEGEDCVKAAGERYLPKLDEMTDDQYSAYVGRSRLYNAFSKTVSGYVGFALRTKPQIEYEDAFSDVADNIDRNGSSIADYIKHVLSNVLVVARAGTLVEYPVIEDGATLADAKDARPYWSYYAAEDILDWEYSEGKLVYIFVRERVSKRSEFYSEHGKITRYRTLSIDSESGWYKQQVYTLKGDTADEYDAVGAEIIPKMHNQPMKEIPFVLHQPDFSPKVNKPILYDLANLCLSFFKLKADQMHGLHFVALPTPWVTGVDTDDERNPPPSTIGPQNIWHITQTDAAVGMLEFSGAGLDAILKELDAMKEEMAILGARMLMSETAEKTATAARIKSAGETADLSAIVGVLEKQLLLLLWITALWYLPQAKKDNYTISMSKQFLPTEISAQMLLALIKAQNDGGIDMVTMINNFKKGEIVDPAAKTEDIITAIQKEQEDALMNEAAAMAKFMAGENTGG